MHRFEIYLADLSGGSGSEQGGVRPVMILQNDTGNLWSTTTVVCPLTSKQKPKMSTHVALTPADCGIRENSVLLCEQVRVLDKCRIIKRLGFLADKGKRDAVDRSLGIAVGL